MLSRFDRTFSALLQSVSSLQTALLNIAQHHPCAASGGYRGAACTAYTHMPEHQQKYQYSVTDA
jgi:hypothetical protein